MAYVRVTITDTMGFWDDDYGNYVPNPHHPKRFAGWYCVPDDWLANGGAALRPERHAAIFEYLYGTTWQLGNGDGSKYVVLKADERVLSPAEAAARPWRDTQETCCRVDEDGVIGPVERDNF